MFVIGTAGHVDHGKSTLVHALTGINPDRLREEQERQMTIDLGFAWLTLPSGREVSMVDVPGHEDFIKNMLAGVGGIDVALLVVAADEAVMPQTREHLAILDLLQVPRGVVALTKSDLIEDPEWLSLVQEEVREELRGTVLQDVAIIPVSALTHWGLEALLSELDRLLDTSEPRRDVGRPHMPIDRVFTISGFGTVVTGTLIDGRLRVGEEAEIQPEGLRARIRGLQTHKSKIEEATPGSRVAVNLSGVTTDALRRGQVLTRPGWLVPTTLFDARLRVLSRAPLGLKHNMVVDLFTGSACVEARARLLDREELTPGQESWVQFSLSEPVPIIRGDRFIIRLASPSTTLGGGQVVDPHPGRRHRRFKQDVLAGLQALSHGAPEEVLLQLLGQATVLEARELVRRSNLAPEAVMPALNGLVESGRVVLLAEATPAPEALPTSAVGVLSREAWLDLTAQMSQELGAYHQRYRLRLGMPREELKNRARVEAQWFNQVLDRAVREGSLSVVATAVALAGHQVSLSPQEERAISEVLAAFRAAPYTPPSLAQVEEGLGAELLQYLLDEGRLVKVSDSVLFGAEAFAEMERRVVAHLREHQSITVAEVRDLFNTSRKYALGLLEDLDSRRMTKRVGDVRVLR